MGIRKHFLRMQMSDFMKKAWYHRFYLATAHIQYHQSLLLQMTIMVRFGDTQPLLSYTYGVIEPPALWHEKQYATLPFFVLLYHSDVQENNH